jgi:transposase
MLFIGFFEGLDSERGIAWRVADSIALRAFLGYELTETTPHHSNLSRTRQRIDLETHQTVFDWVLTVLAKEGLLKGKTLGVDATTLEANAALRSIVRRDSGESYEEFLTALARESGIKTPVREDRSKIDKNRPGKGSNKDWTNPNDPDARITKMKDGRTHLAYKAEHAVDLETGALVAVTVQGADEGDTSTVRETLARSQANLSETARQPGARKKMQPLREVVLDKGYHSNDTAVALDEDYHLRSYISEPDRGRRKWKGKPEEQRAVYANRRRINAEHGRALMRKRGELVERSFAHLYKTGGMRRTHLRGRSNILKRLLVHAAGFNLGVVMRPILGAGTPKACQGLRKLLDKAEMTLRRLLTRLRHQPIVNRQITNPEETTRPRAKHQPSRTRFATGC